MKSHATSLHLNATEQRRIQEWPDWKKQAILSRETNHSKQSATNLADDAKLTKSK